jgi:hypothetical protein
MRTLRETAELLDVHAKVMGERQLTETPLAHISQTEWSPLWQAALLDAARAVGPAVNNYEAAVEALRTAIGLPALPLEPRIREGLRLLATTLPAASGHDWQFVLRPDAKTIADSLRQAVPLVERHRELHGSLSLPRGNQVLEDIRLGVAQLARYSELQAQLSQPWNDTLWSRLSLGIVLLRNRQELLSQMTLPYREGIPTVTVRQLQSDWRELQDSSWPMSMVRRRALTKKLKELATGGAEPDIGADIERLVKIDALQTDIKALDDLSLPTSNAWAGLKTELDIARASLGFQGALKQARVRATWEDVGLDPVSHGQCGDAAREDLQRMREMRQIDQVLTRLTALGGETDGVWSGYETDLTLAKAYVVYQGALAAARATSNWQDEGFAAIENGRAGPAAATDLKKMREMVSLQGRLQEYQDLSAKTIWPVEWFANKS